MLSCFYLLSVDERICKEQKEGTLEQGSENSSEWHNLKNTRRRGACQLWDYKASFRGKVEKQKLFKRLWTRCALESPPNVLQEELLTLLLEFFTWWSEGNWFSGILFSSSQPCTNIDSGVILICSLILPKS